MTIYPPQDVKIGIAPRCKSGGHPYCRGEEIITVEVKQNNKDILLQLLQKHRELGVSSQIDYDKFYLYSIITHSTAIEGSTVTEVEAQLLFDEGITSSKRTMMEQMMNLDLKNAYDFGRDWIKQHLPITVDWLILLASKVMARTGSEYNAVGGSFSAAKGELRMLNVTAGLGGKSYMSYLKVPAKLQAFCEELNRRRAAVGPTDVYAIYELSYWAHFELVTIHPWADGNGRTSRLLMNLLQMEWGLLPSKVLKQDKAMYIQALIDTREQEDIDIFIQCMHHLHCEHLQHDIDQFLQSSENGYVEKSEKYVVKELKHVEKTSEKIIAAASDRLVEELKNKGVQITSEYVHVVDNNAIRHTLNHHGGPDESERGQVPLTEEAILLIPDIVLSYDSLITSKNRRGQDVILYTKNYEGGITIYVEEVRTGRKELAMDTMYIQKK